MIEMGRTQTLTIKGKLPAGLLVGDASDEVLLPNKFVPAGAQVGDPIDVFVYTDSEDRPVATTQTPLAQVGDFACLAVVDQNAHGCFLNWGLDKDLFAPRSEQHEPLIIGRSYVVAVYLDNASGRVAAASRLGEFFDYDLSPLSVGDRVPIVVYGRNERGTQVIVADRYSGLVYSSESYVDLKVGDKLEAYVSVLRDDNKVDVRLQQTGARGQKDATLKLLDALEQAGGSLPLGDRSSPEEIYQHLSMSKKAFKAAAGALYKSGKVVPGPLSIRKVDPASDPNKG